MAWPFQQYVSGVRGPTGFLFSAFIAADGSVLKPSIDDATRWAKSFRPLREMVGIVTRKKGPPESQTILETVRSRLGAKKGLCLLRGHGSAINLPPDSPPSGSRRAVHLALGKHSRKSHLLRLCQSTLRHVGRDVFQRTEEIPAILVVRTWSIQQIVCVRVHGDHDEAMRIGPDDCRPEREQHDRHESAQPDDPSDSNRDLPTADNVGDNPKATTRQSQHDPGPSDQYCMVVLHERGNGVGSGKSRDRQDVDESARFPSRRQAGDCNDAHSNKRQPYNGGHDNRPTDSPSAT